MGKFHTKSTAPVTGMVVGDNKKSTVVTGGKHPRMPRRGGKLAGRVLIVVVLAAIAVPTYMYTVGRNDSPKDTKKQPIQQDGTSTEIALAEQKLANATTAREKAAAYAELSNLYANEKNGGQKSVEYARDGVEQEKTINSYSQLAYALERSGDYKAAAKAYGEAAEMAKEAGQVDDGRSGYSIYIRKQKELEAR